MTELSQAAIDRIDEELQDLGDLLLGLKRLVDGENNLDRCPRAFRSLVNDALRRYTRINNLLGGIDETEDGEPMLDEEEPAPVETTP